MAYLRIIVPAFLFFAWRLRKKGLAILVETWRLPLAAAAWPVGYICYPTWINPRRQYERARQFVIYAFSLLTSFTGVATTSYAQQQGSSGRSRTEQVEKVPTSNLWVPRLSSSAQFFSKRLLKNGNTPYDKAVFQADLTATWKNGFYTSIWGQIKLDDGSPIECDASTGWDGRNVHTGLAYYDLQPPMKNGGGNIVSPYVEVNADPWEIATGHQSLTPFVRAEYIHAFQNPGVNSGVFTLLGLRHHWSVIDKHIAVDQTLWMLHDSGVFEGDHGFVGRYKVRLTIPVSERVRVNPLLLDVSVPVFGISDRKVETVIGAGISITLN